ncbi:MAG TPA: hypothetical protein VEK08_16005, partial [Planctomycetota bacterium]|nr:hypothetical protein [Planctomycetota bacterium]
MNAKISSRRPHGAAITFFVILVTSQTLFAAAPDIWLPRQHAPAFTELQQTGPGLRCTFQAEVRAAAGLAATGWSAAVKNDFRTWTCVVSSVTWGKIHHGTEDGWRMTIRVPDDTPPELLTLSISHTAIGTGTAIRAVQVVPRFEDNFYMIQVSDQHMNLV